MSGGTLRGRRAAAGAVGRTAWLGLAAVVLGGTLACAEPPAPGRPAEPAVEPAPQALVARVVARHPHDPEAFTQGLVWHRGKLYESTGLYGASSVRRVDLASGRVEASAELPGNRFGEGLERVGERLVQLTWTSGEALLWDLETLALEGRLEYAGEGWGLCLDGDRLVRSDGSDRLTFHDPDDLAVLGQLEVRLTGRSLARLNELECAEGWVWANLWQRDAIARIDLGSGAVTALVDASGLLDPAERRAAGVLNGIAYRPEDGVFLLTGKNWPALFEVVFEPRR